MINWERNVWIRFIIPALEFAIDDGIVCVTKGGTPELEL